MTTHRNKFTLPCSKEKGVCDPMAFPPKAVVTSTVLSAAGSFKLSSIVSGSWMFSGTAQLDLAQLMLPGTSDANTRPESGRGLEDFGFWGQRKTFASPQTSRYNAGSKFKVCKVC